jgi:hypothetical protein
VAYFEDDEVREQHDADTDYKRSQASLLVAGSPLSSINPQTGKELFFPKGIDALA